MVALETAAARDAQGRDDDEPGAILVGRAPAMTGTGAGHPWSQVPHRFRGFLAALTPCIVERRAAFEAARTVNALLRRRFPGAESGLAPLVIGSHAKDTVLCGAASIDILFPLPPRAGAGRSGSPRAEPFPVDALAAMLAARFGAVAFGRCGALTVELPAVAGAERTCVRVLPAVATGDGGFSLLAGGNGKRGAGLRIDPRAEAQALLRVDRATGGKARDLVRMLKAWTRAAAVPLPSLAIDRLACEFLAIWLYRRRSLLFYDWMVRDGFFWLAAQTGRSCPVAGTEHTIKLGDGWHDAAWRAYELAAEAASRERDGDGEGALAAWRRIFGARFGAAPQPMAIASLPNGFSASKAANAAGT